AEDVVRRRCRVIRQHVRRRAALQAVLPRSSDRHADQRRRPLLMRDLTRLPARKPGDLGENDLPDSAAFTPDICKASVRVERLAVILALETNLTRQHRAIGPNRLDRILNGVWLQARSRV